VKESYDFIAERENRRLKYWNVGRCRENNYQMVGDNKTNDMSWDTVRETERTDIHLYYTDKL
jgi:hypothetical protein